MKITGYDPPLDGGGLCRELIRTIEVEVKVAYSPHPHPQREGCDTRHSNG